MERAVAAAAHATGKAPDPADWQVALPRVEGLGVVLRELEIEDAPTLMAHVATDEVSRFISPPPTTVDGFERFVLWMRREREAGRGVGFAIVPAGATRAVGVFQVRALEAGFVTAEWGFAMGSAYWGTGLFVECAGHVLDFAFDTVGVRRLEARAVVMNGRGNGALRKIGAVQEGVLRRSFKRHGHWFDQVLWSMLAEDWRLQRHPLRARVH